MQPEELEAIKARCEAATPEPWGTKTSRSTDVLQAADVAIIADGVVIGEMWEGCPGPGDLAYIRPADANAEFCAHARQDVPALVAEVERLRAVLTEIANTKGLASYQVAWARETARCALTGEDPPFD